MTLQQIVEERLRADGFDGLCRADCGCKLDDLMPCYQPGTDCVAGHIRYGTFDGVQGWIIASGVAPRTLEYADPHVSGVSASRGGLREGVDGV